jgi:hypothetical protein
MTRLTFIQTRDTGKTRVFSVFSGAVGLGDVSWYAPWRRYVFFPGAETLFDAACLKEVTAFIDRLMKYRKAEKGAMQHAG